MALRERIAARPRRAAWTMPAQPLPRRRSVARRLGAMIAVAGLAGTCAVVAFRLIERHRGERAPVPSGGHAAAARQLSGGAAVLALSVLADSAIEHYRGAFHNPAMYVAPTVSAVALANSLHMAFKPEISGPGRFGLCGLTLATGVAGLGFHLYNVAKREGGVRLLNLFYGAPLGAPLAITIAGLTGLAAARLVAEAEDGSPPTLLGHPAGVVIGVGSAAAMVGTVAEAALLHFRGAFHDPFMFVPVTLPPAGAAALLLAVSRPRHCILAKRLLQLTALVGLAGAGFHVYGVSRNMGGFANWSQNLLNGPPIPAPPSFTGVAFAGLAAVRLLEER